MNRINRYKVAKMLHPDYVILLLDKKTNDNSNYDKYLQLIMLDKILKCIGNNLTEVSLL